MTTIKIAFSESCIEHISVTLFWQWNRLLVWRYIPNINQETPQWMTLDDNRRMTYRTKKRICSQYFLLQWNRLLVWRYIPDINQETPQWMTLDDNRRMTYRTKKRICSQYFLLQWNRLLVWRYIPDINQERPQWMAMDDNREDNLQNQEAHLFSTPQWMTLDDNRRMTYRTKERICSQYFLLQWNRLLVWRYIPDINQERPQWMAMDDNREDNLQNQEAHLQEKPQWMTLDDNRRITYRTKKRICSQYFLLQWNRLLVWRYIPDINQDRLQWRVMDDWK
ncbi:hypothetical protein BDB01DRAFT_904864 [Pilobolus umbonatus]|nr:hypothetical protein BDB01DRAFT_904864 [Pilobolus umbonatus]